MNVGVVMPAYNEAERIGATIEAIRLCSVVQEIVVIDDGSTDETASEALRHGARVVWHQRNFGKGQALKTGFQSIQSEIAVVVDADLGETASEISKLIEPLLNGQADLAIAVFPPVRKKQGFGIVKKFATWGIQRFTGFQAQAPLSGQRALRKQVIESLNIADGYGAEVAMTIDTIRAGYRVLEVPVIMTNREYGRTIRGFIHRGRQFLHVALALFERWAESDSLSGELQDGMEMKK